MLQSGRIAVLVVITVILAQTLCPVHWMSATVAGITAPAEQSSCHQSFPSKLPSKSSTPAPPNSGQKCCVSPYHAEAILAARYIPTVLMTVSPVQSTPFFSFTVGLSSSAKGPSAISTSPGLLVLRI